MPIREIVNEAGERLEFSFDSPVDGATRRPGLVVIGHGVTANKDRPWAKTLAQTLTAAGFATLRISFSGNGGSEGRFEDSTVSKEVADLGSVLDACAAAGIAGPITYAGHSMGAAVGVRRARHDERIERLVSLGGMVHTGAFVERKFGDLKPGVDVMWDKPECPLSQAYVDDLRGIDSVLDDAKHVACPFLLVHGDEDTVVPVSDSEDVAAARRDDPTTCLEILGGADHVFTDEAARAMADTVRDWLIEQPSA